MFEKVRSKMHEKVAGLVVVAKLSLTDKLVILTVYREDYECEN
jgi:hypothetical protein